MITKKRETEVYDVFIEDATGKGGYSQGALSDFICLSTDISKLDNGEQCVKNWGRILNGSTLFTMDTSKAYMWDGENEEWKELG